MRPVIQPLSTLNAYLRQGNPEYPHAGIMEPNDEKLKPGFFMKMQKKAGRGTIRLEVKVYTTYEGEKSENR